MASILQKPQGRRSAMKTTTLILLAVTLLWGCYAATPHGGDGSMDALQDDPDTEGNLPDSPCMQTIEPMFTALEYDTIVPAHTTILIVVHHTLALLPSAVAAVDGSLITLSLSATLCTCGMCPAVEPSTVSEARIEGGLEAGEYTIRIQDADFPLHVVEDCQRSLVTIDTYDIACPEEARVDAPARIAFSANGTGCGCGGVVETSTEFVDMGESYAPALMISAEEVVCDPSQCCVNCRCIDTYSVEVSVSFPEEGLIPSYANGDTYLCSTMVFGADGCSDWDSMYSSIVSCPPEVMYGDPLEVMLSVSSGYCCSGEAFVEEQREGDTVTLSPGMHVCEGSCCYMCDCMDYTEVTHAITGLSIGSHRICVSSYSSEQCVDVFVYGLD
jgi:hypothetical protein